MRPTLAASSQSDEAVRALAFDGDSIVAAGRRILRGNDGGASWTPIADPGEVLALGTHWERPGRIAAGLALGGVAVSDDGGQSWEPRNKDLPMGATAALAVAAAEPDAFYAAIEGDGLWKSEDAGRSWTLAMDRPWLAEAERDITALASVSLETGMGGIWVYAGTAIGLTRVPDCFCRWQDVQPGNAMDALVEGSAASAASPLPAGETIRALVSAPSAPDKLYAALASGLWTSGDAGVAWSRLTEDPADAVAVHAKDARLIVAAFEVGLKTSHDGGATWSLAAARGDLL